ncbi:MAG TPA: chemotaxis protein CheW [Gemmatimonadales bacterium]|nr:chemotaxis protein CheW [Gemmatimonadales bacterium]
MADQTALRLVLFRLGSLVCAAPATGVREVIPAGSPTRIPGASASVSGLLNLRGTLLTVVSGARIIGLHRPEASPESVLVLDLAGRAVGLEVDEVIDLIEVPDDHLENGEAMPGIDPRLVRQVGHHDGRVFAVLELEKLVAPLLG